MYIDNDYKFKMTYDIDFSRLGRRFNEFDLLARCVSLEKINVGKIIIRVFIYARYLFIRWCYCSRVYAYITDTPKIHNGSSENITL